MDTTFPRARQAIEDGIAQGLHLGAQLYVSVRGKALIDAAFGMATDESWMTRDTLTLWFSAGKPLTAVAIAQLVEAGRLSWDTAVSTIIPAFGAQGKNRITLRHVLTHTAGLHVADDRTPAPWEERIASICNGHLPPGWVPGEKAAYSATAGWYILGEVVRIASGELVANYVREHICRPAGMLDSNLCLAPEKIEALRDRVGSIYDTGSTPARWVEGWNDEAGLERCAPGGSARGPVRELGKLYEILLGGGAPLLSPASVAALVARQRTGIFDETFQYRLDCGLGFILNSNREGMQMPYGYGRDASPGTFGHSGNQCSCAFADPERQLVVAWACNGMPGERRHQQRQRAINNAVYGDLLS